MTEQINKAVFEAYQVISTGGIILYPTDTLWGIGCDARNELAVQKIFNLKKRSPEKSMIVLLNDDRLLYQTFATIPSVAFDILDCAEKPTTLVLDAPKNVASNLIALDNSLGFRIVKEPFVFKLIQRMKSPLVSTSANFSGKSSPLKFQDISPEIISGVDYVVPLFQDIVCKKASSVIKLTNDSQVKILRK